MIPFSRYLVPMLALAAGAVAVSLHLGCSNRSEPAGPTSIKGRVSFQGEAVPGAMVVFAPDRERGMNGKPIRTETGTDGVFELKGEVPPGWYRVAIAPPADSNWTHFPPQLRRPDTSTISREIVAGKENTFEFAIEVTSSVVSADTSAARDRSRP
jgi:hypothetical protein